MAGTMLILRSEQEVDNVHNEALNAMDKGTKFPGMSYEEGIDAAIRWMRGDTEVHPMAD